MQLLLNRFIFAYGTLLLSENDFGGKLRAGSGLVASGSFPGELYYLGDYPGAVYRCPVKGDRNLSGGSVKGLVYRMNDPVNMLKLIDGYEGYDAGDEGSEFIRKEISVKTDNGEICCWVYLYNLPTVGLTPVPDGDYLFAKGPGSI